MIKTIIFDYGGVLTKDSSLYKFCEYYSKKYNFDLEKFHDFLISLWQKESRSKTLNNFFKELSKYTNRDVNDFKKEFISKFHTNDEMFKFIKEKLRGRYQLAILSNNIREWFSEEIEDNHLRKIFDEIITSYDLEMKKPEKDIYQRTLKILNKRASECIFIDDKQVNIIPAKELGINAILFTNTKQCIDDINKLIGE